LRKTRFLTDEERLKTTMTDLTTAAPDFAKPDYVSALEHAYGAPSQAGFGSAVFYAPGPLPDLAQAALDNYRYFVGDRWEQYGGAAWLGPWRQIYTRPPGTTRDIVGELRALPDRSARQSAGVMLDDVESVARAQTALAAAFDDPAVTELAIYRLGDGGAINGILVAGRRQAPQEALFLVFLID